jgi:hypothetical protein
LLEEEMTRLIARMEPQPQSQPPALTIGQRIKAVWKFKMAPRTQMTFYGFVILFVGLWLIGFAGIMIPVYGQYMHSSGSVTRKDLASLMKDVMISSAMVGLLLLMFARKAFGIRKFLADTKPTGAAEAKPHSEGGESVST